MDAERYAENAIGEAVARGAVGGLAAVTASAAPGTVTGRCTLWNQGRTSGLGACVVRPPIHPALSTILAMLGTHLLELRSRDLPILER